MNKATRVKRDQIQSIPCPKCDAAPGRPCRSPNGGHAIVPHQERRHAAAEAGVYTP